MYTSILLFCVYQKQAVPVKETGCASQVRHRPKNHLGSTTAVINDKGELIEATMYTAYGEQIPLMVLPGTEAAAREKFTGKEFDTEGGSGNGVDGINSYHFKYRIYDPEIGIWNGQDMRLQDWNTYGYCGSNPINSVDPNGAEWWPWVLAADFLTGGLLSVTAGAIVASAGVAVANTATAMATTVAVAISDPVLAQSAGGINNVIHNWEGITTGNNNASKFWTSFWAGTVSGTADWGNAVTFGVYKDAFATQSAAAIGFSHNYSYDKDYLDAEAYEVSYKVLRDMYSYGAQGSWAKISGDLTWSFIYMSDANPFTFPAHRLYNVTRNRFNLMKQKMNMEGMYADFIEGTNAENIDTEKNPHRIGGLLMGGNAFYYGFEVWGEPTVQWEIDDYLDDNWYSSGLPDPYGYWNR